MNEQRRKDVVEFVSDPILDRLLPKQLSEKLEESEGYRHLRFSDPENVRFLQ